MTREAIEIKNDPNLNKEYSWRLSYTRDSLIAKTKTPFKNSQAFVVLIMFVFHLLTQSSLNPQR